MNPSRRQFFQRGHREHATPRMPWLDVARFLDRCTACAACAEACPEGIITIRDGALPAIDFARGGCTFCGHCADACPEALFNSRTGMPWQHQIALGRNCLAYEGVVCQSCRDVCEPDAITFPAGLASVATPRLDPACCTTCGACIGTCPVDAIGWTRRDRDTTRNKELANAS